MRAARGSSRRPLAKAVGQEPRTRAGGAAGVACLHAKGSLQTYISSGLSQYFSSAGSYSASISSSIKVVVYAIILMLIHKMPGGLAAVLALPLVLVLVK